MRPEKGTRPSFLDEADTKRTTRGVIQHKRAMEAIKSGSNAATARLNEYFDVVVEGMESFRIAYNSANAAVFDEEVVASINDFAPYKNHLIEIFTCVCVYLPTEENLNVIHRFFEKLIPFMERPAGVSQWSEDDFDNYKYIINELFLYLIAIFIKHEKFDCANYFIDNQYYSDSKPENKMINYCVFQTHLSSLDHRNQRLNLRRYSLHADMLKNLNSGSGIDFKYIMTADFVLYLRGAIREYNEYWWPTTLLFVDRFNGPFEMFARARSKKYFNKISKIIDAADEKDFADKVQQMVNDSARLPKWNFDRLNVGELSGVKYLATTI